MTTVSELKVYVGRRGVWRPVNTEGIGVNVKVVDASSAYGRTRLTIEPVSGQGQVTTEACFVEVEGIETPPRPSRPDVRKRMKDVMKG